MANSYLDNYFFINHMEFYIFYGIPNKRAKQTILVTKGLIGPVKPNVLY